MKRRYALILIVILITAIASKAQETGTFTDARDGKTYKTVKIGSQTWMAENLNASRFRNGDVIPEAKTLEEWQKISTATAALCCYNGESNKGKIFGKLYNWFAVGDPRGLAPPGWHIPTEAEWRILTHVLGDGIAGKKMRFDELSTFYPNGWATNQNSDNESDFTAIPGGHLDHIPVLDDDGDTSWQWRFEGVGFETAWWSRKISTANPHLTDGSPGVTFYSDNTDHGLSVRCVKD